MRLTLQEPSAAGRSETRSVETQRLPDADAARLERSVADADFFLQPDTFARCRPDDTAAETSLTVEDQGRRHTIRLLAGCEVPDFIQDILSLFEVSWRKLAGS